MSFLIDGYNLLHAMGLLRGRAGPAGLEKARLGLLGLLSGTYGDEAPSVTVVFDAANAPVGAAEDRDYRGIHVRFAIHQEQADDEIENLIRHDSAPRQLTVVSDDHRLQQAARRRHCKVLSCDEYLEWLDRHRQSKKRAAAAGPRKPPGCPASEKDHWLDVFADLQDDANLKALSIPPEWQECDH